MIFAPLPWSPFLVFSPRMTHVVFIRSAIFGISSEMAMPGTLVLIARNGPPVGAPGFGSHVSSCDAPPASHRRMTRFCVFLSAPFTSGAASALSCVMSAARVAPVAAAAPRKARRFRAWSAEPQKNLEGMVDPLEKPSRESSVTEPELRRGHERPEHLPVRFGLVALSLLDVSRQRPRFLFSRRTAVGRFHQELDCFLRLRHRLYTAEHGTAPVGQELLHQPVAVAEHQRLADADLEVVGRLRDEAREAACA